MDEKVFVGVVSALLGALATYVFAVLKLRKELEYKYDTDLRDKRIPQYLALWMLLEVLAKYARPRQLTFEDLRQLSVSLREWYFQQGGLFLSDKSRDDYFALQDGITDVLAGDFSPKAEVDEAIYETLRAKGSTLRTAMTQDVGTRKAPQIN